MYQRLVVPLDGSDLAEHALVEAENMAALTRAPIHLVRVIEFASQNTDLVYGNVVDSSDASALVSEEVDAARQYLEFVAKRLSDQGYDVSHEVRRGSVAHQLVEASKAGDLYVMASHGRSGISRWFMGSVAEEVVRRSPVSVLLVRSPSSFRDRSSGLRDSDGETAWRSHAKVAT